MVVAGAGRQGRGRLPAGVPGLGGDERESSGHHAVGAGVQRFALHGVVVPPKVTTYSGAEAEGVSIRPCRDACCTMNMSSYRIRYFAGLFMGDGPTRGYS